MFAPPVKFAFERKFPPGLAPIADGGEPLSSACALGFPKIHHHRLTSRYKPKAVGSRYQAIGLPNVLSVREESAMRLEILQRLWPLMIQIDFDVDRVSFQVNQPPRVGQLRARQVTAMQVQNQ